MYILDLVKRGLTTTAVVDAYGEGIESTDELHAALEKLGFTKRDWEPFWRDGLAAVGHADGGFWRMQAFGEFVSWLCAAVCAEREALRKNPQPQVPLDVLLWDALQAAGDDPSGTPVTGARLREICDDFDLRIELNLPPPPVHRGSDTPTASPPQTPKHLAGAGSPAHPHRDTTSSLPQSAAQTGSPSTSLPRKRSLVPYRTPSTTAAATRQQYECQHHQQSPPASPRQRHSLARGGFAAAAASGGARRGSPVGTPGGSPLLVPASGSTAFASYGGVGSPSYRGDQGHHHQQPQAAHHPHCNGLVIEELAEDQSPRTSTAPAVGPATGTAAAPHARPRQSVSRTSSPRATPTMDPMDVPLTQAQFFEVFNGPEGTDGFDLDVGDFSFNMNVHGLPGGGSGDGRAHGRGGDGNGDDGGRPRTESRAITRLRTVSTVVGRIARRGKGWAARRTSTNRSLAMSRSVSGAGSRREQLSQAQRCAGAHGPHDTGSSLGGSMRGGSILTRAHASKGSLYDSCAGFTDGDLTASRRSTRIHVADDVQTIFTQGSDDRSGSSSPLARHGRGQFPSGQLPAASSPPSVGGRDCDRDGGSPTAAGGPDVLHRGSVSRGALRDDGARGGGDSGPGTTRIGSVTASGPAAFATYKRIRKELRKRVAALSAKAGKKKRQPTVPESPKLATKALDRARKAGINVLLTPPKAKQLPHAMPTPASTPAPSSHAAGAWRATGPRGRCDLATPPQQPRADPDAFTNSGSTTELNVSSADDGDAGTTTYTAATMLPEAEMDCAGGEADGPANDIDVERWARQMRKWTRVHHIVRGAARTHPKKMPETTAYRKQRVLAEHTYYKKTHKHDPSVFVHDGESSDRPPVVRTRPQSAGSSRPGSSRPGSAGTHRTPLTHPSSASLGVSSRASKLRQRLPGGGSGAGSVRL